MTEPVDSRDAVIHQLARQLCGKLHDVGPNCDCENCQHDLPIIEAALLHAQQVQREEVVKIAECYLHSEPDLGEESDELDRVARYSNGTVRHIIAAIQARASERPRATTSDVSFPATQAETPQVQQPQQVAHASLVQEMETLVVEWREQAENMRLRRGQTTGPMAPHRYIENCASAVEALLRRSAAPPTEEP